MAYDPENPPSLMVQNIGGTVGLRHYALTWIDPIATVLGAGYISNAADIGMRAGDFFQYSDVNMGQWSSYFLICTALADDGSATFEFPEVPEDALPVETYDVADPNLYVVMYVGGRQVRVALDDFSGGGGGGGGSVPAFASQAEAEAGAATDKIMSPLRVAQAIDAQVAVPSIASQAEAEAGSENTKFMTALRVAQAIDAQAPGGGVVPTITAYMETLLDDADAATARGTLGLTIATSAEYRANTASKVLTTDQVWGAAAPVTLTDAATIAVDLNALINGAVTLGGNRTLGNPTNAKPGQSGMILITQDATGSRTLAFASNWKFAFGTDPTLSTVAGSQDVLFYTVFSSTLIVCSFAKSVA